MPYRPELVVALIAPAGSRLEVVERALADGLDAYGYTTTTVRVSSLFRELPRFRGLPIVKNRSRAQLEQLMDAGDSIRRLAGRADSAMLFVISEVIRARKSVSSDDDKEALGRAYVVNSLKTPEELHLLRAVYGNRLLALGVYESRASRIKALGAQFARAGKDKARESYVKQAVSILERDERGANESKWGQNVSGAFPLCDYFVDCDDADVVPDSIDRFLCLVFGSPWVTPTRDEQGMFLAYAASLRSASLSRQVGAAITTDDGDVLSLGCNEVPKAGGGQYWEGDRNDAREFQLDKNTAAEEKRRVGTELLQAVLYRLKWQPVAGIDLEDQGSVASVIDGAFNTLTELAVNDLLEFYREVHAEMAAIVGAARRGIPLDRQTLFTTTFPCHDCAKHIVDSGLRRVVFIEPYPKSRAVDFHADSLVVDPPRERTTDPRVRFETYIGLAPGRYLTYFRATKRKGISRPVAEHVPGQAEIRTGAADALYTRDDAVLTAVVRGSEFPTVRIRETKALSSLERIGEALTKEEDDGKERA